MSILLTHFLCLHQISDRKMRHAAMKSASYQDRKKIKGQWSKEQDSGFKCCLQWMNITFQNFFYRKAASSCNPPYKLGKLNKGMSEWNIKHSPNLRFGFTQPQVGQSSWEPPDASYIWISGNRRNNFITKNNCSTLWAVIPNTK